MRPQSDNILTDVYSDWLNNGIFKQLEAFDIPWKTYVSGNVLDLDYYGNHSGSKLISPLVHKLLTNTGLSAADQAKLAALIFYKYNQSWTRAWQAITAEYEPLENYHRTEIRTPDLVDTRTDDLEYKRTANLTDQRTANLTTERTDDLTQERTDDLTEQRTADLTTTKDNDITEILTPRVKDTEIRKASMDETRSRSLHGFNSDTAVPAETENTNGAKANNEVERTLDHTGTNTKSVEDDTTTTETGTDTVDRTGTVTVDNTGTQTTTESGTDTNTRTGTDTYANTGTQELTHTGTEETETYGNIGVTTSQQMLEAELNLRFKWNFFEGVFKDVDEILTINVYGHSLDYFTYDD